MLRDLSGNLFKAELNEGQTRPDLGPIFQFAPSRGEVDFIAGCPNDGTSNLGASPAGPIWPPKDWAAASPATT